MSGGAIARIQARRRSDTKWKKLARFWNKQESNLEHDELSGLHSPSRIR